MSVSTHLSHGGLPLSQAHDEDAVGLAEASLGPGRQAGVRLVEHDAVEVLLLTQPAGQPILMHTDRQEGEMREQMRHTHTLTDGRER